MPDPAKLRQDVRKSLARQLVESVTQEGLEGGEYQCIKNGKIWSVRVEPTDGSSREW